MSVESRPTLGIIGAGKVGGALARLAYTRGYTMAAVASRSPESARALAKVVDAVSVERAADVIMASDLTLVTVPDGVILPLAAELATELGAALTGKAVAHTAGIYGAEVLAPLAEHGAQVGSLHPAYPFADAATAEAFLAAHSVGFALEAEDAGLRGWLSDLVRALGGVEIAIPKGKKALYHAALCLASNYAVTLADIAARLLRDLGADDDASRVTLTALLAGTQANLAVRWLPDALTGPLTRADTGTIASHIHTLAAVDSEARDVYLALARATFPLLRARGMSEMELAQIVDVLESAPKER